MAAAVERVGHVVWDAHVVEAVFFDGFVVEPGAVAGFPFQAADHAELGCTATGHVITAFFQLDHSPAIVTSLPASLFRCLQQSVCLFILRTILRTVPFPIT